MGNRINFNKSNPNRNKKAFLKRILAFVVIFLMLIFLINSISKRYKKEYGNENNNANVTNNNISTSSLESVLNEYSVKLLNYTDSENELVMYVKFDRDLFDGEKSNQHFFMNLSKYIAEYIDYKNFKFIDEKQSIEIEVKCEKPNITQFIVNGDSNYFQNKESEINMLKSHTQVTQFSIQSNELSLLNENKWDESVVNWGTRESLTDGYNIYFDEGIKYKNVSIRVFNLVFTEKYNSKVVGGLRPGATQDQVISSLGEPTFRNESDTIFGYLGEKNYVFFDFVDNQISCYPVKNILETNENDFLTYVRQMNETGNIKDFAKNLTTMWVDYDVYDFQNNYVELAYTLRGIKLSIKSSSLENGLFIYQNYSGDRSIVNEENVYMKAEDSVFEKEKTRVHSETMNRADPGDFTDEYIEKKLGLDFSVKFNDDNVSFYSRDRSYADSSLDRNITISSYMWLNGYIFIYSTDNDGIYAYNCQNRTTQKLLELNEKITIDDIENSVITYNENKTLKVVIE